MVRLGRKPVLIAALFVAILLLLKLPSAMDRWHSLRTDIINGDNELTEFPVQYKSNEDQAEYWRKFGQEHGQLPDDGELERTSSRDVHLFYHSYLDNLGTICHRTMRIGDVFDGGRRVCDDEEYRPRVPCIVYSFEMEANFTASDAHDLAGLYGCRVYFFDPSKKGFGAQLAERVWLYDISIGGKNGELDPASTLDSISRNWQTRSLTEIKGMLGHQNIILDVLKLAVNGREWVSLANMAATRELDKVRQLIVTFHNYQGSSAEITRPRVYVLRALERAGLKIFSSNLQEFVGEKQTDVYPVIRTNIYEVSFVNTRLARPADSKRQLDSTLTQAQVEGKPLPGIVQMEFLRKYGKEKGDLPEEERLKSMPDKQVHYIYHSFLDNIKHHCRRMIKLGQLGDGGYKVCDDAEFRPGQPCLAYSFGIRGDFSFDDDVASFYGCKVFSFDPSMEVNSHRRSTKVTFNRAGLGGRDGKLEEKGTQFKTQGQWRVESLSSIKKLLNHTNTLLDIVKLDIEESEWIALADMAASGQLGTIRQLLMEFHIFDGNNTDVIRSRVEVLRRLEMAGFRVFYTWQYAGWPGILRLQDVYPVIRTICYETSFVNVNLARTLR